ncbi:MAG TPA: DNA primase, partial [Salinimicrobium sp.]|nr:DNA primase [Salinimicrobium sp.]
DVLFSTLAQISAKEGKNSVVKRKEALQVVREENPAKIKVDELYELEKTIIGLLLMYGTVEEEFEDLVLKENEKGELIMEPEIQKSKVFEKIFLDLQEDEVAFTNEHFQKIYVRIISKLNEDENFSLEKFLIEMEPENASEITNILMEEEQYSLHDWERMNIFVKGKKENIGRRVNETILSLRRYLVSQKINDLNKEVKEAGMEESTPILEDIMNYLSLKKVLSSKLNRVM